MCSSGLSCDISQDLADMVCAIHWLYIDFWFSGKLTDRGVGFFGSISSIVKLYFFISSLK